MKIEITKDNTKYSVEREEFEAETALDDFLNLLFISGTELTELEKILKLLNNKQQENHKKDESKTIQGFSNL